MFGGIFSKKPPKRFGDLSTKQKAAFARNIARFRDYAAGARYKVVSWPDESLREVGITEMRGEADILDRSSRGKMLDLARNLARNSSTFNALLKQFDLNAVGTVGGKAIFGFEDVEKSRRFREAFADWAQNCEFYDGMRLGDLLKTILKTYLIGGEMVLLFDDGKVEDSGRVLIFEPDEMGNLSDADFFARFPKGFTQTQGHIKNANRVNVGVVVSKSQRGLPFFAADSSYILTRDPFGKDSTSFWLNPRNIWRKDQVIGTPPAASSLATIIDLEDLANYELQAAKKNSQTIAQVVHQNDAPPAMPSSFDSGVDFSSLSDEEVAQLAQQEAADRVVSFERLRGANVIYEDMPDGVKLEMLDTKHPNQAMPEFIRWLAGRAAAPYGLGSVYATLKADQSYTAFRGEQVMSWPAFEEAQKFLEHICDWILARWAVWADRRGILPGKLDDGWNRQVSWMWPKMREVNQVDEQNAIRLRLQNGTGTYSDILGPDWREILAKQAEEHQILERLGLPHPRFETASGAVISMGGEANG